MAQEARERWEYMTIPIGNALADVDWNDLERRLDEFGADGWEAFAVTGDNTHQVFLKRRVRLEVRVG